MGAMLVSSWRFCDLHSLHWVLKQKRKALFCTLSSLIRLYLEASESAREQCVMVDLRSALFKWIFVRWLHPQSLSRLLKASFI